ncbi:MAG: 5-formyltetrahydrofolate cyclo-ligase [Lawsonibacter sp.]|nr:5-formyltetrahydrofolate cyclo-ligase [Lawsonibacter sp.]
MPSTIDLEKKALRRQVREQLSAMTPEQMRQSDEALFTGFLALPQVQAAKTIFAFWGIPGKEPDTARLVEYLTGHGKAVGLPRMLPEHQMEVRRYLPDRPLVSVSFGISEPGPDCPLLSPADIDLVLVPAVCYDRQGYRLGFGGGYYDRWLEHFAGFRVGLCRSAVLQNRVPTQTHDARVDVLITETESLSF